MDVTKNLDRVLAALPSSCQQRLTIMGWPGGPMMAHDPNRVLRRAIGAPQEVDLVDLELDPERWHGAYVSTQGTVGWSRETTCLGRLWLNPLLSLPGIGQAASRFPSVFQARISGIVLADARLRADHRQKNHSPGGYGNLGLFIAELVAASISAEPDGAAEGVA